MNFSRPTLALLLAAVAMAQTPNVQSPAGSGSGSGTEAAPWTHSDGTAGIQSAVNALNSGRGGRVDLAPGRYDLSAGVSISNTSTTVEVSGKAPGFSVNGATSEGTTGSKLHLTSAAPYAVSVGGGSIFNRPPGVYVHDLYVWGGQGLTPSGATNAGFVTTPFNDQPRFRTLRVSNTGTAFYLSFMDGGVVSDSSIHYNGYGFYITGTSWFSYIIDNQVSDNRQHGLYATSSGTTDNLIVRGNLFLRNCEDGSCSSTPANVFWARSNSVISSNTFQDAGYCLLGCSGAPNNRSADELYVAGSYNSITGNTFQETATQHSGFGCIRLVGNHNVISGNAFQGCLADVIVTGSDNVIDQPGAVVSDSGARNVVNGLSSNAGDPDTTGSWIGAAKWAGLTINDITNGLQYLYLSPSSRITLTSGGGGGGGGSSFYQTVQGAGSSATQRAKLNFVAGSGCSVAVTDESANNATNVTISSCGSGGGVGSAIQSGTFGSLPTCNTANDQLLYLFTDSPYSRAFCQNPTWTYYTAEGVAAHVPPGGWAWVNQGSATSSTAHGSLFLTAPAATGDNFRILKVAAPAAPYIVTAYIRGTNPPSSLGLVFRDSVSGKLATCLRAVNSGVSALGSIKYNSATSWSGTYAMTSYLVNDSLKGFWLQIEDDGASRKCEWSVDGNTWNTYHSVGRADFMTADEIGVAVNSADANLGSAIEVIAWRVH